MKYKTQYEAMHQDRKFDSTVSLKEKDCTIIRVLVAATGAKTLLDFGSGTGVQYDKYKRHELFGIQAANITCYDPGIPGFSTKPEEDFDCVISTDVLEHIPEDELPEALEYIFDRATKFVYLAIFCGLAIKTLPDGSNAHCTIKPPSWWKALITTYNKKNIPLYCDYRIPVDPKFDILNLYQVKK